MNQSLPKASAHIKDLLPGFQEEAIKAYPESLLGILLFGSYARGDFSPESDIDLMLLFDDGFSRLRKDDPIFDIILRYIIEKQVVINPLATKKSLFESRRAPLYLNVKKEGIELWKK